MFIKDIRKLFSLGAELFLLPFCMFSIRKYSCCMCLSPLQSKTKCAMVVLKRNILSIFIVCLKINSFTKQCKWVCVFSWKGENPGFSLPIFLSLKC